MGYVNKALFVYDADGEQYVETVVNNRFDVSVASMPVTALRRERENALQGTAHVVVCAELAGIKEVMLLAYELGFSLGILPRADQSRLRNSYCLPQDEEEALEFALTDNSKSMDLVFCNDKILLFKGSVGRVPLIDSSEKTSRLNILKNGLLRLLNLHLLPFTISTYGSNKIKVATAACGFLLFENPERSFATKLVSHDHSCSDKMVSMMIVAPFSVVAYLQLMVLRLFSRAETSRIPESVGYIKSPHITIGSDFELNVKLDGKVETSTPLEILVVPEAIRLNYCMDEQNVAAVSSKEKAVTHSLPKGKELLKIGVKRVPFFTYASEERFKDLFVSLREDSLIDSKYVVLMCLSTILATVGLYLNSGSVVIGAMLLAPLMAPIISMAMGLLRYDRKLFWKSLYKVFLGILLALAISVSFTLLTPYQPFTAEMQARLNPTMLDLLVAIAAGVAGAYTKSYKEILQSLAGVAIAVALVPPLAVAGIGLGRFEFYFFQQAFLLFSTNLIGIILAAVISFRILGFSPVVRDKRGVLIAAVFFMLIAAPLFMAFQTIVDDTGFEQGWKKERFLVNNKYLIVNNAKFYKFRDKKVLVVKIHAREPLNRFDLTIFKKKIQRNFSEKLLIRAEIVYIP